MGAVVGGSGGLLLRLPGPPKHGQAAQLWCVLADLGPQHFLHPVPPRVSPYLSLSCSSLTEYLCFLLPPSNSAFSSFALSCLQSFFSSLFFPLVGYDAQ